MGLIFTLMRRFGGTFGLVLALVAGAAVLAPSASAKAAPLSVAGGDATYAAGYISRTASTNFPQLTARQEPSATVRTDQFLTIDGQTGKGSYSYEITTRATKSHFIKDAKGRAKWFLKLVRFSPIRCDSNGTTTYQAGYQLWSVRQVRQAARAAKLVATGLATVKAADESDFYVPPRRWQDGK